MFKNTIAYLMFIMLGLPGALSAQTFNQAQEEAFTRATIRLLEGIIYVDDAFNFLSVRRVGGLIARARDDFGEIGGIVDARNPVNLARVTLPHANYNSAILLNTIRSNLDQILVSLNLLQSFLFALEQDRLTGPLSTYYRDGWRSTHNWEDEYRYDDDTGAVVLDENGDPVIEYHAPRNVAGHLVGRIRRDLQTLLAAMDPVLRDVFGVRNRIIVRGVDEEGLYEDRLDFDLGDLADALFNQVTAAFIPRRTENQNGLDLRSAVNYTLRDLDVWLETIEIAGAGPQLNRGNNVLTYRFHEGQAEVFAEAMIAFINWVLRMDGSESIVNSKALLVELRTVRSRFRNVLNAPSQQEQYEFMFDIVEHVLGDEPLYADDLNNIFVGTHAERARNRERLNQNHNGLIAFDYDGMALLQQIDEEINLVEEFLINFLAAVDEEDLARRGLHNLFFYYQQNRGVMERRLGRLINGMEPILRNVFGILPSNGLGPRDLQRGFEQWLAQNQEDYPLLGALGVPQNPVLPDLPYRGNVDPRDLFEGNVPQIEGREELEDEEVRPLRMNGNAPSFVPTQVLNNNYQDEEVYHEDDPYVDPYQDPVVQGYYYPQQHVGAPNPYPQQGYNMEGMQLVPGAQPGPYPAQQYMDPHTGRVFVIQPQQPYLNGQQNGYPQQYPYVEPCIQQQLDQGYLHAQDGVNLHAHRNLQMPTPVRAGITATFLSL